MVEWGKVSILHLQFLTSAVAKMGAVVDTELQLSDTGGAYIATFVVVGVDLYSLFR